MYVCASVLVYISILLFLFLPDKKKLLVYQYQDGNVSKYIQLYKSRYKLIVYYYNKEFMYVRSDAGHCPVFYGVWRLCKL
ncbi:hypothetical protein XELAEV_18045206mg [Xenopus laevis]|uniref:Uncharacterized protein n=1 Tax=Xenopus laevis TaxID=8355 RepID=A0A974C0A2_XENLA|nr:hypothetical protein XELAEV_18045206mg [Xenopus laevis]